MSEPLVEENITDIDGREHPTLEIDLTPGVFRSTHSSRGFWHSGLEAEWRPIDRAGVGLELDAIGSLDGARPVGGLQVVPRGALSYVVVRDFARRIFLQVEAGARADDGASLALADPTEFAQPFWAGLREAVQLGPLDIRASALGEVGGASAHAPVRAGGAALVTESSPAHAAVGAELLADWSRESPFVVVPELQAVARLLGRPVRLEIALPFTVGARATDESYGVALRFVLEPSEP